MNRREFVLGLAAAVGSGCRSHSARTGAVLRLMTYNLHHGEGVDGRLDLERIANVIAHAKPDLVALQEVDRKAARTRQVDQAAEYARMTGLHSWYGAAMPFQGGEYGQALLSRWPLVEPRVIRLPGTLGREPRIAVTAWVDAPGFGRIQWTGVHLDASRGDEDRWAQAGALLQELGRNRGPGFLAGDFNDVPESRTMRRMLDSGSDWEDTAGTWAAPTIPAESPKSRIDYVLATPRGAWEALDSSVLPEAVASDHRPVLVVVRKRD